MLGEPSTTSGTLPAPWVTAPTTIQPNGDRRKPSISRTTSTTAALRMTATVQAFTSLVITL